MPRLFWMFIAVGALAERWGFWAALGVVAVDSIALWLSGAWGKRREPKD